MSVGLAAMLHCQHSEANTHTWRSCTNASVCVSVHTGTRCQRSCVNATLYVMYYSPGRRGWWVFS